MMSMLILVLVLFFLVILVTALRNSAMYPYNDYDEEVVTTTTTTTTTTNEGSGYAQPTGLNINGVPIVGMLTRQFDGSTPFVIDPVDGDKMYLNTKDDIYEDGAGKWWGLQ